MSELLLRDSTEGDKDAIREVTVAANEQYGEFSQEMWLEYKGNILETLADIGAAQQIVAERDGEVVGTVLLYPSGVEFEGADGATFVFESYEVRLLAVTPGARGQGIGKLLMEECLARARAAGATALSLHTLDIMRVAMGMYERMGFVRTPETDISPAPGIVVKGYRYELL